MVWKNHPGLYLQTPSSSDRLEAICSTVLVIFYTKKNFYLLFTWDFFLQVFILPQLYLPVSRYLGTLVKMRYTIDFNQRTVCIKIQPKFRILKNPQIKHHQVQIKTALHLFVSLSARCPTITPGERACKDIVNNAKNYHSYTAGR